jgi:hypothetical protein
VRGMLSSPRNSCMSADSTEPRLEPPRDLRLRAPALQAAVDVAVKLTAH